MVVVGPAVGLDVVVVGFPGVVSGGGPGTKEKQFSVNVLKFVKENKRYNKSHCMRIKCLLRFFSQMNPLRLLHKSSSHVPT